MSKWGCTCPSSILKIGERVQYRFSGTLNNCANLDPWCGDKYGPKSGTIQCLQTFPNEWQCHYRTSSPITVFISCTPIITWVNQTHLGNITIFCLLLPMTEAQLINYNFPFLLVCFPLQGSFAKVFYKYFLINTSPSMCLAVNANSHYWTFQARMQAHHSKRTASLLFSEFHSESSSPEWYL